MIIRSQKNKDNPYTIINNQCLKNKSLSAKSKGIYAYVMSLPDDWKFYADELENHFTDGRDSIRAGLRELEENGYLEREQVKKGGKFSGMHYVFKETPQTGFPATVFPASDSPRAGNPQLLNTDSNELLKENNEPGLGNPSPNAISGERENEEKKKPKKDILLAVVPDHHKSIWEAWNFGNGIRHRSYSKERVGIIDKILETIPESEIFSAIQNYSKVVSSKEHFWDYKWTLKDFLKRGLERFMNEADPLNNFKIKKTAHKKSFSPQYAI